MNGVIFNDKHTYRDWGLLLRSRPQITPPTPKLKMISVPGSDRIIDLTQALTGEVHCEPRTIAFEFVTGAPRETWANLHSNILTYMHGQSVNIFFDDDPNWYYTGRTSGNALAMGGSCNVYDLQ